MHTRMNFRQLDLKNNTKRCIFR